MTRYQKVLWSEGLFLTPHHLQQWDQYHEELVSARMRAVTAFGWGAEELQINIDALQNGVFELQRCRAVFPDGLTIAIPETDPPPPSRSFTAVFAPASERLPVYLAIPIFRAGAPNLALDAEEADSMARYVAGVATIPDQNSGENPQPVSLAQKNLRLLFGEDSLQNHIALEIAALRRTSDGKIVLDDAFIPPSLSLSASNLLIEIVKRLYEILVAKSTTLADLRRQRAQGLADFTTSDVANFWLLHTVNSYVPLMMHYHHIQRIHPEQLYLAMARMAAELTTFVTEGSPMDLPKYIHTDLSRTFVELDRKLRILLETVIPTRCVAIPLERNKESLYIGRITDERLLSHAEFFLGVSARMPEAQLVERVPRKSKIASIDTITFLLGQALPGVPLRPVPVPPGAIPTRMGFKYFRLEKLGTYWETIAGSRSICLYFPAEFPELKLELFALKD